MWMSRAQGCKKKNQNQPHSPLFLSALNLSPSSPPPAPTPPRSRFHIRTPFDTFSTKQFSVIHPRGRSGPNVYGYQTIMVFDDNIISKRRYSLQLGFPGRGILIRPVDKY